MALNKPEPMKIIEPFRQKIAYGKLGFDYMKLRDFAVAVKEKFPSRQKSNNGGYQTPDLPESDLTDDFFKMILEQAEIYAKEYCFKSKLKKDNHWINFNKRTHTNNIHTHPNSLISGVYYIKTPTNCGVIKFFRNDDLLNYHFEDSYNEISTLTNNDFYIQPELDMFILFPSNMKHSVETNHSAFDRISLSFNLKI